MNPNLEKIEKGLRFCFETANCDGCPYEIECRKISFKTPENHCPILDDVLSLLKEQNDQIEQLEHDLAVTQNNLNYYVNGND